MRTIVLLLCAFLAGCGTPAVTTTRTETPQPTTNAEDRDRAALIAYVKKYAQNPKGLEIIELSPPGEIQNQEYFRTAAIRCESLGFSDELPHRPFSRSAAQVRYHVSGKVMWVSLRESGWKHMSD